MAERASSMEGVVLRDKSVAFGNIYEGKTLLITGHTGFKGSWLTLWATLLGAKVIGYSAYLPSDPCNYRVCGLEKYIVDLEGDVRDFDGLGTAFKKYKPDMVFHLAAQPIVARSYEDPKLTFDTNVGGTVNILECIRNSPSVQAAVIITSDKCYKNVEWPWGYRENDVLGGDDPYSASKACAELVSRSYIESFFRSGKSNAKIATARAGNVIGGGDWARARILPDCVRAWSQQKAAQIRNPSATRPWQHVLEPLSGYLWLGASLLDSDKLHGEAFNFGPDQSVSQSVGELIEIFLTDWGSGKWKHKQDNSNKKESMLLKLSCDKALHFLNWHSVLSFNDTVRLTAQWYQSHYRGKENMYRFSLEQIKYYSGEALRQGLSWAGSK